VVDRDRSYALICSGGDESKSLAWPQGSDFVLVGMASGVMAVVQLRDGLTSVFPAHRRNVCALASNYNMACPLTLTSSSPYYSLVASCSTDGTVSIHACERTTTQMMMRKMKMKMSVLSDDADSDSDSSVDSEEKEDVSGGDDDGDGNDGDNANKHEVRQSKLSLRGSAAAFAQTLELDSLEISIASDSDAAGGDGVVAQLQVPHLTNRCTCRCIYLSFFLVGGWWFVLWAVLVCVDWSEWTAGDSVRLD
jgi:hypothetical protein